MSFTKENIYNLTFSALLLAEEVTEISTSKSLKVKILNKFWDIALASTLQDLDLDSTSQPIALELIETLDDTYDWDYVYKYPTNCAFLRRIKSGFVTDNSSTHISKRVGIHNGQKAIFTNQSEAVIECIPKDVPLSTMSPMAIICLSYKLAILSSSLVVGKGAKSLKKEINDSYIIAKLEAQETDKLENFNYESETLRSEFARARMS